MREAQAAVSAVVTQVDARAPVTLRAKARTAMRRMQHVANGSTINCVKQDRGKVNDGTYAAAAKEATMQQAALRDNHEIMHNHG